MNFQQKKPGTETDSETIPKVSYQVRKSSNTAKITTKQGQN